MKTIRIGYAEFNREAVEGKTREQLARDFDKMRPEILDELHKQVGAKEPRKEKEPDENEHRTKKKEPK